MTGSMKDQARAVAVLTSGGVESAGMLAEALQRYERVYPIYVRKGFIWEKTELYWLRKLLAALAADGLARLTVLDVPVREIYGHHWSLGKRRVPGKKAPDRAVYLPGRNLILLSLGGLFCSLKRVPALWVGILKGNPFHDARSGFIRQIESLLQEGLGTSVRIASPLGELTKPEVLRRYRAVPWEMTFSCLRPIGRRHCGRCQKCAERMAGFRGAEIQDPAPHAR